MKTILILGGSASGKSEYAEKRAAEEAGEAGERIYLAVMEARDKESLERIRRHREMRAGKGFRTVECPRGFDSAGFAEIVLGTPGQRIEQQKACCLPAVILLEDLSNLAANEMFLPDGQIRSEEETLSKVRKDLRALETLCKTLIIVGNRLTEDGNRYDPVTEAYLRAFCRAQNEAASRAEEVIVVTAGIPERLK